MVRVTATSFTGAIGILAAVLTGAGEFILHFDPAARFSENYAFFLDISDYRSTIGHFIGALSAPFYIVGCWHIRLMLMPANPRWANIAFYIGAYGFAVGAVWLGSRASISALMNVPPSIAVDNLIALYETRYESLLQIIRVSVLLLSAIYIWLVLTGRSHYPRWMSILNPILLIVASFVVFVISPALGKYIMPIALNVAFAIFFILSTGIAIKKRL